MHQNETAKPLYMFVANYSCKIITTEPSITYFACHKHCMKFNVQILLAFFFFDIFKTLREILQVFTGG